MGVTKYNKLISDIPQPDAVIFRCCNVSCPNVPSQYAENWGLDDSSGKEDAVLAKTIAQIEKKVLALKEKLRWPHSKVKSWSVRTRRMGQFFCFYEKPDTDGVAELFCISSSEMQETSS